MHPASPQVQALIKIEEEDCVVLCRQADVGLCQSQAASAIQTYKDIIAKETGEKLNPKVTVNTDAKKMLQDHSCMGGIVLTACHGRIVCDNTLDARIQLTYSELLPEIRNELWDKHGGSV